MAACQIALLASGCGSSAAPLPPAAGSSARMALRSPAFADGGAIPVRFTCSGAGERPPLRWSGVPGRARELVLVVTDPDAGGFVHWTVFGMSPRARSVPASARQGRNTFGQVAYGPPCPPRSAGAHRYVFDLYALARPSGLRAGAAPGKVIAAVRGALARGQLVGRFGRR